VLECIWGVITGCFLVLRPLLGTSPFFPCQVSFQRPPFPAGFPMIGRTIPSSCTGLRSFGGIPRAFLRPPLFPCSRRSFRGRRDRRAADLPLVDNPFQTKEVSPKPLVVSLRRLRPLYQFMNDSPVDDKQRSFPRIPSVQLFSRTSIRAPFRTPMDDLYVLEGLFLFLAALLVPYKRIRFLRAFLVKFLLVSFIRHRRCPSRVLFLPDLYRWSFSRFPFFMQGHSPSHRHDCHADQSIDGPSGVHASLHPTVHAWASLERIKRHRRLEMESGIPGPVHRSEIGCYIPDT